jgi:hypothetical protein
MTATLIAPGKATEDVILQYNPVSLVAGQAYTLSFLAKADNGRMALDALRDINAGFGSASGTISLATVSLTSDWQRYYLNFVAPMTTTKASLLLKVGRDGGTVSFDKVGLYQGGSDLFRRDFQNGIVVVNGSSQTQTVNLEAAYKKIRGSQNPLFNDGAQLSSLTLAPYDAVILLRARQPSAVGGIAELPDVAALPSAASSGRDYSVYTLLAAVAAFIVAVAGVAGWRLSRTPG